MSIPHIKIAKKGYQMERVQLLPRKERLSAQTAYKVHKANAKHRSILFELTFAEWWAIWQASGHWHERGCKKGQYVMARFGDIGPYAAENVKIILATQNTNQHWSDPEVKARHRAAVRISHNRPEFKARISTVMKIALNRPEVRERLSAAIKMAMNRPEVRERERAAHLGRRWINNGQQNRKLRRGEVLPDGWEYGRNT
jgi:hypothetical protein